MQTIDTARIEAGTDLIELAGRSVELRKVAANEYGGPCPKCGGTDRLHVKRDWWFCRQCYPHDNGKAHDAIAFVMWRDDVDFREACKRLDAGAVTSAGAMRMPAVTTKQYRWGDPEWQAEARCFVREAQDRLAAPEGEPGWTYLTGRGLTPETWQAWGLGYATPRHPALKEQRPAIILPWQGKGTVKAVQYRFFWPQIDKGDRFGAKAGGERTLYGVDLVGSHFDTLLLCEGELNAMSIWQAGRPMADRLDVLSFGSEGNATGDLVAKRACRYRRVIVWADDPDKARAAMVDIPGTGGLRSVIRDGQKLDANMLLHDGILGQYLTEAIARLDTLTASEVAKDMADDRRPLIGRLTCGLNWLRDREMRSELGAGYEEALEAWLGKLAEYEHEYDAAQVVAVSAAT